MDIEQLVIKLREDLLCSALKLLFCWWQSWKPIHKLARRDSKISEESIAIITKTKRQTYLIKDPDYLLTIKLAAAADCFLHGNKTLQACSIRTNRFDVVENLLDGDKQNWKNFMIIMLSGDSISFCFQFHKSVDFSHLVVKSAEPINKILCRAFFKFKFLLHRRIVPVERGI